MFESPIGPKRSEIRAVIGTGLEIIELKIPLYVAKVKITNIFKIKTQQFIKETLEKLYNIELKGYTEYPEEDLRRDKFWGEVAFHDEHQLERALKDSKEGWDYAFTLQPTHITCRRQTFTLKLRWNRRPKYVTFHKNEVQRVERNVIAQISNFIEKEKFKISLKPFGKKTEDCEAFATFYNKDDCATAASGLMHSGIRSGDQPCKVYIRFIACVSISATDYLSLKPDIEEYMEKINAKFKPEPMAIHEKDSGEFHLNILIASSYKVAKIILDVDTFIRGDTVEIEEDKNFIFHEEGKIALKEVEEKADVSIIINHKSRMVTVRGLKKNRQKARALILQFIEHATKTENQLMLYCQLKTPGLLKALLVAYGNDLADLQIATNAKYVHVNYGKQILEIKGDDMALKTADDLIKAAEEAALFNVESETNETECVTCTVCLDNLNVDDSCFYILPVCGHIYCKVCLASIITQAMKELTFPIHCVTTGCEEKIKPDVLQMLFEDGLLRKEDFVAAACCRFVKDNRPNYEYCINPSCSMVYKTDMNFKCPLCFTEICGTCSAPYHIGVDCAMYARAKVKQKKKGLCNNWKI